MLPKEIISREERYLYAIATGDLSVLPKEMLSRYERYLSHIARSGGTGGDHKHGNKAILDMITKAHLDKLDQLGVLFEEVEG